MARTTTTTDTLGIGLEDSEIGSGTTRAKTIYLKIPNPKADLTESQIKQAVQTLISGENPILLDTYGEPYNSATAIVAAYTETQEIISLDTGYED